jgi:enoyl-CoA hydratase/carnithine racemase
MSLVSLERRGGAAIVTYANPPFGTMTAAGAQELLDKLKPLVEDAQVRSIIVTGGVPGIFIRHYDVGELSVASDASKDAPPLDPAWDGKAPGGYLALVDLIYEAPKPVVAAINGLCMGGGFELALACESSARPRRWRSSCAASPSPPRKLCGSAPCTRSPPTR